MTKEQIELVVDFVDKLFRSRTPPKELTHINASDRVINTDTRSWAREQGFKIDMFDVDYQVAMTALMMRLRKEFPNERWDEVGEIMREFCKQHGIKVPKTNKPKFENPLR